ncbi:hypothetical protein SBV1_2430002 [Verrucomicrobia bacterium]|nr:hypothetical protein SBV1_2430002 [Verrucomicrobiota bacterium]
MGGVLGLVVCGDFFWSDLVGSSRIYPDLVGRRPNQILRWPCGQGAERNRFNHRDTERTERGIF